MSEVLVFVSVAVFDGVLLQLSSLGDCPLILVTSRFHTCPSQTAIASATSLQPSAHQV